ncbi:MAG: hypothetical protein JSR17_05785 [Proteobacteria bacterium]|nr:hypothetical protein [Pseudomonadota bacterium]
MFTLKNEPQNSHQILEQGFSLYKHAFASSLPYSLCAAFLMIAPYTLSTLYASNKIVLWGILIAWLAGFTLLSGLIFRLYCICYNVTCHFTGSLTHAMFKLIPLLLLTALYCLIVLSGTMMFIIPGIIFAISLMFSFILVITDNQNVFQTLTLSHRLVWGQWWHVASVICIPLLLNIIFSLTLLLGFILVSTKLSLKIPDLTLGAMLINITVQSLFIPLIFSMVLVLLHDLRRRAFLKLPRW